jgi:hypothetical protein
MENKDLHAQKVTILSRLIKESSLTFEEALLILKEEEPKQSPAQFLTSGSTGTAYIPPLGTWSTTGMPTFLSMTGSGTSSITNTIADDSADLNN